ncbi:hypothetical protein J1614_005749 [Plenodomus biglobosus]|nr:hypothetical protein J1614_005749 [Plenodomus biglobosus]
MFYYYTQNNGCQGKNTEAQDTGWQVGGDSFYSLYQSKPKAQITAGQRQVMPASRIASPLLTWLRIWGIVICPHKHAIYDWIFLGDRVGRRGLGPSLMETDATQTEPRLGNCTLYSWKSITLGCSMDSLGDL